MSWTELVTYGTYGGGMHTGQMGFEVHLTAEEPSPEELADILIRIRNWKRGAYPLILLQGTFPSEQTMFTLVKSLRDSHFQVMVRADGQTWHSWFSLVNWLIIDLEREEWPGFACNEIRYLLEDEGATEPLLPSDIPAALYLCPAPELKPAALFGFIRTYREHPWAVYLPAKKVYKEVVWTPER